MSTNSPMTRNPFIVGSWVRGEDFFGRSAVIGEILEGERHSLWVLGGRDRVIPLVCVGALVVAALAALGGIGALPAAAWLGLAGFAYCHFALLDGAARPARLRAVLAFAFGLMHGFGFAGVLMEMEIPTSPGANWAASRSM